MKFKKNGKSEKIELFKTRSHSTQSNFQHKCKCKMHNVFISISSGENQLHFTTSHEINKEHLLLLISHGCFTTKARYVCGVCLNFAGENLSAGEHLQDPQTDKINVLTQSFEHSQEVQCVAKMIQSGEIPQESLVLWCKTIGNVLNKDVYCDSCHLKGAYKDTSIVKWGKEQPKITNLTLTPQP